MPRPDRPTRSFALLCVIGLGGGVGLALMASGACAPFSAADPADAGSDGSLIGDAATASEASVTDSGSAYAAAVLADTPLAYWRLGEPSGAVVARSVVGDGTRDGTIAGDASLGQPGAIAGDPDTSLGFSTEGQLIAPGGDFDFNGTAPFSLEAWVRPTLIDIDYRHLFSKDGLDKSTIPRREEYGVYLQDPGGKPTLTFERFVDDVKFSVSATPIAVEAWHHVVATYDGGQLVLYVDGVVSESKADPRMQPAKSLPFYFGGKNPSSGSLVGTLDEVAVYDRALSLATVQRHFQIGSGNP